MSKPDTESTIETGIDRILTFAIPASHARGRIVRLGPVLDDVLQAHDYHPAIKNLLAEALVLTALIGSLMKGEDSQLTLQAQSEGGAIDLLACDYRAGEIRGYVREDKEKASQLGSNANLATVCGSGYLAITFDLAATGERYQGIVPLEGESLSAACEHYFRQSEQIPTLLRVAVKTSSAGALASGFLLQHLPEGEEMRERLHVKDDNPEWEHVEILGSSLRHDEMLDLALPLDSVLWRLFHEEEEVRVSSAPPLTKGCRCTPEHYRNVLMQFPESERQAMRNDEGKILVDCAFCSKEFPIDL